MNDCCHCNADQANDLAAQATGQNHWQIELPVHVPAAGLSFAGVQSQNKLLAFKPGDRGLPVKLYLLNRALLI